MLLKRRPFRDGKDLVDGFGRESGRFCAVVSGRRGGFDPPVLVQARLSAGSGLSALSQLVTLRGFGPLKRDLSRLLAAGFLGRLFLAAMPEGEPDPSVYALLESLFCALDEGACPRRCGLLGQARLLLILGVAPELDACVQCGGSGLVAFQVSEGGTVCRSCYSGGGLSLVPAELTLARALLGASLEELEKVDLEPLQTRLAGRIFKAHFVTHLGLSVDLFRRVLPPQRKRAP